MIPKKPPAGKFRFRLIGGSLQLRIDDAEALNNVLLLDEAFWAMTGVNVASLRFERRFLNFLDADGDGHIRCTEVKEAVKFLLGSLRDLSGVISGSEKIYLNSINPDAPGAAALCDSFRLIAGNLGKSESDGLSAGEICSDSTTIGFSRRNGDGIITPDADIAANLSEMIANIIASGRVAQDRSGVSGVSRNEIDSFAAAAAARLAHAAEAESDPAVMVYGENTPVAWSALKDCENLIDGYFLNAAAAGFFTGDPGRTGKMECAADLMVPADVRKMLESAVAAKPAENGELDFNALLNPLYADKLHALEKSPVLASFCVDRKLSAANWQRAKAALAPYGAWLAKDPAGDGLESFSREQLQLFIDGNELDELRNLCDADLSFATAVGGSTELLKLTLFQQYMLEFLNNFVALPELFNPRRPSRLQMGKLIMDGRHFTLTVPVHNLAEHKRIIQSSDICVLYVEISRSVAGAVEKQLLAVAVTGGTMRTLFVGKHGIFMDTDGNIYDARITDMVDQPVSVWEALKSPFFRFADFLGKQAEKIFNTRNAEIQKNMTAEFSKNAAVKPAAAPAAPAANLPMMLMGGGIGIAALGSSVAFIAKSLQNVSFFTVLAVIAGIMVIFGGPIVVLSLVKLYRRNLARFLESCGCAVNRPMRLTRRMGAIFTFVPKRPKGELLMLDPAELIHLPAKNRTLFWKVAAMLLALLLGAASGIILTRTLTGKMPQKVEKTSPAKCEKSVSVPAEKKVSPDKKSDTANKTTLNNIKEK